MTDVLILVLERHGLALIKANEEVISLSLQALCVLLCEVAVTNEGETGGLTILPW